MQIDGHFLYLLVPHSLTNNNRSPFFHGAAFCLCMEPAVKGVQHLAKGQELNIDHEVNGIVVLISNVTLKANEVVLGWSSAVLLAVLFCYFVQNLHSHLESCWRLLLRNSSRYRQWSYWQDFLCRSNLGTSLHFLVSFFVFFGMNLQLICKVVIMLVLHNQTALLVKVVWLHETSHCLLIKRIACSAGVWPPCWQGLNILKTAIIAAIAGNTD